MVVAMSQDGVPVDDERILNFLAGASATEDCDPPEEIIIINDGPVEFMVVDRFVNGQYFYGTDIVRMISWDWKCR